MSEWTHTLLVVVPENLMAQANQLALAVGTSEEDSNTFQTADWTDGTNAFAVAHTAAVTQILDYFAAVDPTDNNALAEAISLTVFPTIATDEAGLATLTGNDMSKIQVMLDVEPFAALGLLGLERVINEDY